MPSYYATVQVLGFVEVEVQAISPEEAKKKIETGNIDSLAIGDVETLMFQAFEKEPSPEI